MSHENSISKSNRSRLRPFFADIREPLPLRAARIVPLTSQRSPARHHWSYNAGMHWLVKEEPTHYGFDALVKDKKAVWSGVRNALAQKHLRTIRKGDRIFYYHSGDERAVVGIVKAVSDAYPDPEDPSGKYVAVDVVPVKRLPRPVTLAEVKADPGFKDFPLVRIGRLSVMPVTDAEWARIERMSGKAPRGEP